MYTFILQNLRVYPKALLYITEASAVHQSVEFSNISLSEKFVSASFCFVVAYWDYYNTLRREKAEYNSQLELFFICCNSMSCIREKYFIFLCKDLYYLFHGCFTPILFTKVGIGIKASIQAKTLENQNILFVFPTLFKS